MKISKLFHWLYAILMLLPFVFFVPSVLYYAFNDNATMQSVEVPKTETISVDFNQKVPLMDELVTSANSNFYNPTNESETNLTYGCTQRWSYSFSWLQSMVQNHLYVFRYSLSFTTDSTSCKFVLARGRVNGTADNYISDYSSGTFDANYTYIFSGGTDTNYVFGFCTENANSVISISDLNCFDLTQMFGSGYEPTLSRFNELFPSSYYPYTESELMQITYDTGETEQLVSNTDIINYAWESIWDLPLFSWTKVTFIAVPFTYITGLFGLAASNTINYVFGYFLSISIVWLVFDVIMYVPLLCHRWIDKARIE